MTALSIQPTFPIFTDIDGQPLENGYIWIGTKNLNPQTNPINVYWDAALTIQATQPIRTLAGYPSNSGTPARLYVNSDYSIRVQNRNGSLVYSAPAATERYGNIINAQDVVYDPPFTGAVQTNVEAKLAQTLSVLDFGADNTGATNTTTAIQAAIDAAEDAGGGTVYFPSGEYLVTVINLKNNVNLLGAGESSQITTSYAKGGAIFGQTVENIDISHIFIQGNNLIDPDDPQNGDTGIYVDGCTNVKVHHCKIDGVFAWGMISVDNSDLIDFSHNTVTNIGNQSAIACDNGTTNFIIANNLIRSGKLYGVEVESSNLTNRWGVITGNIVEDCVAGISLNYLCEDIVISSNVLRNNNNINTISGDFGYGVYINGSTGAGTLIPKRIIIDSNIIHTHKKYAVLLSGKMNEVTVSNNYITKGGTATNARCITAVNSAKTYLNIINNNIDCSNISSAINVSEVLRLRIEGNTAQNLWTEILEVGGSVTSARVEMPLINNLEASAVTGGVTLNGAGSNFNYSNDFPEYTVITGSTDFEYLTAQREMRVVGISWCINPTSIGGGASDYWVVNINGVDVNPTLFATTANRDNWSFTTLNTLLSAGDVIRVLIKNGLGTTFNHYRYRLITL